MKRLIKKSNHVEPTIHNEVEDKITNPETNINENQSPAFLLMKQLFAEIPYVNTGTIGYQFARKIENGDYENISSIEDAQEHLGEWVTALKEFIDENAKQELNASNKKKD